MALRVHCVVCIVHDERTVPVVLTVLRLWVRIVTRILRVTSVSHKSVNIDDSSLIVALDGRPLRDHADVSLYVLYALRH